MKKEIIILFVGILLIGLVFAAQEGQSMQDGTGSMNDEIVATGGQQGDSVAGEGIGVKIMAGNYVGGSGQQMMIKQQANNQIQLRVNEVSANCGLNLTQKQIQNKTKLETKLSNGRNAEIKVMPDTASETALARLRLKVCSEENECQIELKEIGSGEQVKVAYEMKVQKQSKFLGMFKTKMQVQAQIDAETGEIVRVRKPWWAFLASEPAEE